MRIKPAPQVCRPPAHDGRTPRLAPPRRDAAPAPAALPRSDGALASRDAALRRLAAEPGFAVAAAAPYVAQQIGQSLAEETGAAAPAAYRRCEEAIAAILRPPLASSGITV